MVANKVDLSQFKTDRVKFEEIGDTIAGRLLGMDIKNGNSGDVLVLTVKDHETGIERQVWCPTMLASAVADEDPEIGAYVTATLTGFRNVGRPSPLKEFQFTVSDEEPW
jgi:hypothetical protein